MFDLDNQQQKDETKFNKMALPTHVLVFYFHSFLSARLPIPLTYFPPIDFNHRQPESPQLRSGKGNFGLIFRLVIIFIHLVYK